jgi:serine/threonine protein kinase
LALIDKFEIIKDIALGIQAFPSKKMVHRDIKPENVLFIEKITKDTKMISAKLSDYGEVINFLLIKIFIKINFSIELYLIK